MNVDILINAEPNLNFKFEHPISCQGWTVTLTHGIVWQKWYLMRLESPVAIRSYLQFGMYEKSAIHKNASLTRNLFALHEGTCIILKLDLLDNGEFKLAKLKNNQAYNNLIEGNYQIKRTYEFEFSAVFSGGGINPCLFVGDLSTKRSSARNILTEESAKRVVALKNQAVIEGDMEALENAIDKLLLSGISYFHVLYDELVDFNMMKKAVLSKLNTQIEFKAFEKSANRISLRHASLGLTLNKPVFIENSTLKAEIDRLHKGICVPYTKTEPFAKEHLIVDDDENGDPSVAILFYSAEKLGYYKKKSVSVYADGTQTSLFKLKGRQLFVVLVRLPGERACPLFYWFVKKKTTNCYDKLLRRVRDLLELEQNTTFHCDFEVAIMNAAANYFNVVPCYFHASQALFRAKILLERNIVQFAKFVKPKRKCFGISELVSNMVTLHRDPYEAGTHIKPLFMNFCKVLFFLNSSIVPFAIKQLGARVSCELESVLLDYVVTFVNRFSRFLPINGRGELTNNVAESYFSALKKHTGKLTITVNKFMRLVVFLDKRKRFGRAYEPFEDENENNIWALANMAMCENDIVSLLERIETFDQSASTNIESDVSDPRRRQSHLTLNRINLQRVADIDVLEQREHQRQQQHQQQQQQQQQQYFV